jgi:hypothetical protein
VPETRVLAIASHVRLIGAQLYSCMQLMSHRWSMGKLVTHEWSCLTDLCMRYVGNKMAAFVMQSLGCDVSAINTVHYSKHDSSRPCSTTIVSEVCQAITLRTSK